MADELVTVPIRIQQRAEGMLAHLALGALINEGALRAGEGCRVLVRLDQILSDLRPDQLDHPADVADDRVVALYRMPPLYQIAHAEQRQRPGNGGHDPQPIEFGVFGEKSGAGRDENAQDESGVSTEKGHVSARLQRKPAQAYSMIGRWLALAPDGHGPGGLSLRRSKQGCHAPPAMRHSLTAARKTWISRAVMRGTGSSSACRIIFQSHFRRAVTSSEHTADLPGVSRVRR